MTAIVAIKHQSGITVKGDSLRIIPDGEKPNTVKSTKELGKIHGINGRGVIAFAGDSLGENIEASIVDAFRRTLDAHPKDSVTETIHRLETTAFKVLETVDKTYGTSTQILVAGYDVSDDKQLVNPSLWIINSDKGEVSTGSANNYAPIGSTDALNSALHIIREALPEADVEKALVSKEIAGVVASGLLSACEDRERSYVESGKVAPLHVGGAIDHWEISADDGPVQVSSNENGRLAIQIHEGDAIYPI